MVFGIYTSTLVLGIVYVFAMGAAASFLSGRDPRRVVGAVVVMIGLAVTAPSVIGSNQTSMQNAHSARTAIESSSQITVPTVSVSDAWRGELLLIVDGCEITYKINANQKLIDGTLWPLVPGTGLVASSGNPSCSKFKNSKLDELLITGVKESALWRN